MNFDKRLPLLSHIPLHRTVQARVPMQTLCVVHWLQKCRTSRTDTAMQTLFVDPRPCQRRSTSNRILWQPGLSRILSGDPICGRPTYGALRIVDHFATTVESQGTFAVFAHIAELNTAVVHLQLRVDSSTKAVPPSTTTRLAGGKALLPSGRSHHHRLALVHQAAVVLLTPSEVGLPAHGGEIGCLDARALR
ncbi:hypothetical protein HPB51_007799 [Rhipicephalus microplus]|uniref:Uncharacterized protein n=1 Tax=Rhipicephalus microplus TaxID=6941 RepID=A0A9J6EZE3_RHIMP|nr:hypothetical protein HPB51_007799 [Rhipicephalus microplus]